MKRVLLFLLMTSLLTGLAALIRRKQLAGKG